MMAANRSTAVFLRLLRERLDDFKDRLRELMQSLPQENRDDKVNKARNALRGGGVSRDSLSKEDQPYWLEPVLTTLESYSKSPNSTHAAKLAEVLAAHYGEITAHSWEFDSSGIEPFDFDGVYEHYRNQSRIPELFDNLIGILEEIVGCEELDSRKVVQALDTLMATLKKNRAGSFFSVVCTWDFVRTYLKNVAWELLENVPVLGSPVSALRTTIDEIDKQMSKLHQDMKTDLSAKVSAEFPSLTYRPLALSDQSSTESDEDADSIEGEEQG